jgi:hypothetical protein
MARASGHRAGEPVEFGHGEGVAFADGGQGLVQAGAVAVGTGQPVVEVDAVVGDAEFAQPVPLGGEVLGVGGAAGVADHGLGHDPGVYGQPPTFEIFTGRGICDTAGPGHAALSAAAAGVRWGFVIRAESEPIQSRRSARPPRRQAGRVCHARTGTLLGRWAWCLPWVAPLVAAGPDPAIRLATAGGMGLPWACWLWIG